MDAYGAFKKSNNANAFLFVKVPMVVCNTVFKYYDNSYIDLMVQYDQKHASVIRPMNITMIHTQWY